MAFFNAGIYYGSGAFYIGASTSASQTIPLDLRFYRTSQDGIYVFWWGFNPAFISPSLSSAGFDLELDTAVFSFTITAVDEMDSTIFIVSDTTGMSSGDSIYQGSLTTQIVSVIDGTHVKVNSTAGFAVDGASADIVNFTSPNLVTWTELTAITFQNGNVRKGFAVPVAARINVTTQIWYARVRTRTPSLTSDWSTTLIWTIPPSIQQSSAEALMESLPDYHVYGKGDLLLPVDERNTNLWVVEETYGNQLDTAYYQSFLTQTNNYIDLAVDEVLYQNFGVLFNFLKPNSMQYVDYRWILMNLYLASLVGGTNQAIIYTIQAFTGVPPAINNVRDFNNFILTTSQDDPITPPGFPVPPQTVFFTSTPYAGDLVVEDLTTGARVLPSAYVENRQAGTWTMNVGTYDTLQATFDTGNPIKIFDSLEGATALTGIVTFEHGSNIVTGTGTLFLTEVNLGQQITDPEGIYLGTVASVVDDTTIILTDVWYGPDEDVTAYVLLYTDTQLPVPVLWDKSTLAFGIIVTIFNPGLVPLAFIDSAETLALLLAPAHTKIYFIVV